MKRIKIINMDANDENPENNFLLNLEDAARSIIEEMESSEDTESEYSQESSIDPDQEDVIGDASQNTIGDWTARVRAATAQLSPEIPPETTATSLLVEKVDQQAKEPKEKPPSLADLLFIIDTSSSRSRRVLSHTGSRLRLTPIAEVSEVPTPDAPRSSASPDHSQKNGMDIEELEGPDLIQLTDFPQSYSDMETEDSYVDLHQHRKAADIRSLESYKEFLEGTSVEDSRRKSQVESLEDFDMRYPPTPSLIQEEKRHVDTLESVVQPCYQIPGTTVRSPQSLRRDISLSSIDPQTHGDEQDMHSGASEVKKEFSTDGDEEMMEERSSDGTETEVPSFDTLFDKVMSEPEYLVPPERKDEQATRLSRPISPLDTNGSGKVDESLILPPLPPYQEQNIAVPVVNSPEIVHNDSSQSSNQSLSGMAADQVHSSRQGLIRLAPVSEQIIITPDPGSPSPPPLEPMVTENTTDTDGFGEYNPEQPAAGIFLGQTIQQEELLEQSLEAVYSMPNPFVLSPTTLAILSKLKLPGQNSDPQSSRQPQNNHYEPPQEHDFDQQRGYRHQEEYYPHHRDNEHYHRDYYHQPQADQHRSHHDPHLLDSYRPSKRRPSPDDFDFFRPAKRQTPDQYHHPDLLDSYRPSSHFSTLPAAYNRYEHRPSAAETDAWSHTLSAPLLLTHALLGNLPRPSSPSRARARHAEPPTHTLQHEICPHAVLELSRAYVAAPAASLPRCEWCRGRGVIRSRRSGYDAVECVDCGGRGRLGGRWKGMEGRGGLAEGWGVAVRGGGCGRSCERGEAWRSSDWDKLVGEIVGAMKVWVEEKEGKRVVEGLTKGRTGRDARVLLMMSRASLKRREMEKTGAESFEGHVTRTASSV